MIRLFVLATCFAARKNVHSVFIRQQRFIIVYIGNGIM